MEPAERQEKIPTESQKEKEWERLQGEWKHIGVQNETIAKPGKKLHEERKRERRKSLETRDNREDLKRKKLQKFSWGPGEKRKGDL